MDKIEKKAIKDVFPWDNTGRKVNVQSKLTINDFEIKKKSLEYVEWEEIKRVLGKHYPDFKKFIRGQACYLEGVYKHDLESFIKNN